MIRAEITAELPCPVERVWRTVTDLSRQEWRGDVERVEVTVGEAFCAWPGDLVRIQRAGWGWNGRYRAAQVIVGMDSKGYWSRMELAKPDFTV